MRLPTLQEREDRYIRRVWKLCQGSTTRASKVLGIGRATLYRRLYVLGLIEHKTRAERVEEQRRAAARRAYLAQFERPPRTL